MNFNNTYTFNNNIVELLPLTAINKNLLKEIALQNPNITKYSPIIFNDETSIDNYLSDAFLNYNKAIRYPFIILDKINNKVVGTTSICNVSNKDKRLEIGFTLVGKTAQGTAINKNVKFLLLCFAFETLQFERVELKTDERNLQSRKAILKLGATEEGTLRSHTLMYDGYRRNTVYYSILKDEWQQIKSTIFSDCYSNQ
ncbi:MAG: GNAT family protein [Chitinophagales bacterium]